MTREERERAIKEFREWRDSYYDKNKLPATMFIEEVIKILEQEPYGDLISRQAVHIELEKWITYGEYKYSNATKYLYDRIDRLPPVNPQEPKYCDRNICISNEYNGISCKECEVTKSQESLEAEATELQKAYNKGFNNCKQMVLVKKELVELEDGQSFYCISPEDVETLTPVHIQSKTDTWSIKDVADTLAKHGLIVEQESCEDAIGRQAVIDTIENWLLRDDYNETERHIMRAMQSVLYDLPSVNPQSRTGHWIYDDIANNWRCNKCGETPKTMGYVGSADFMSEHFRFCNHCGAKMVEPQERSE